MDSEDLSGVPEPADGAGTWDAVERLLPGAVFDRRYRVVMLVSADDRTARFAGEDVTTGRPIAVEVMTLDVVGGLRGAVALVNAVNADTDFRHPDVVPTLAAGLLDSLLSPTGDADAASAVWSVTELRAGGTLRQLMDRGRRLTPSQAVVVGFHAARALVAFHERGVVHGEVSPRHLRFSVDGRVGLSGVPLTSLIAEHAWVNTDDVGVEQAWYAAPELAVGGRPSPSSDVYSLCLVLIEAVTGEVPFAHASTVATLGARMGRLLPVSADLGPLASVLERAGRPDPAERSTAAEFLEALVRCAESLPRPDTLPIVSDDSAGLERPVEIPASPDPRFASPPPPPPDVPPPTAPPRAEPPPPPARRRRRWFGFVVAGLMAVALLAGVIVWASRTPSYEVPDLVDRPAGELANQVADFDWTLDIRRERSDSAQVDQIIRTEPAAGTTLKRGGTLIVVLSQGPTLVALADVTGLPVAQAFAQLEALGLVAVVTAARSDENAPVDVVLRWYVADQPALVVGADVVKGTEIALEVSQGPAPRDVPDVVGRSADDARSALEVVGLVAEVAQDFSDTVPIGDVAAQSPLPGTVVPRDSSVLVVVSQGPDVVAVPELEGFDAAKVAKALADADLALGTVTGDPVRRLLGVSVDGTPVRAGDQVPRGSTVALVYEFAL